MQRVGPGRVESDAGEGPDALRTAPNLAQAAPDLTRAAPDEALDTGRFGGFVVDEDWLATIVGLGLLLLALLGVIDKGMVP